MTNKYNSPPLLKFCIAHWANDHLNLAGGQLLTVAFFPMFQRLLAELVQIRKDIKVGFVDEPVQKEPIIRNVESSVPQEIENMDEMRSISINKVKAVLKD